jgi:hypothetical protein
MPRSLVATFLLTFALTPLLRGPTTAADEKSTTVEVGFAEVDITPTIDPKGKPVYLAGFGKNRKATGVNDRLYARGVVFREKKTRIAVVSVDLVGLFLDSVERIRKELPGFAHIVISSTHNHEGPDTLGLWGASALQSGIDPDYQARVEKQIVQTIKDAEKNCQASRARIGTIKVPELLHDSRLPRVLHDDLVVLHFQDQKGEKNRGLVVQWNCHPETLGSSNTLVSADYVGYTVKHLHDKYRCPVVYLTGTVGGLMTSLHVPIKSEKGVSLKDGTFEKTARYGELLGQAAEKAVARAKPISLIPLSARSRSIYLPLANKLYVVARQLGVFNRETYLWKGDLNRATRVKEVEDPKLAYAVRTEIAHLRLGELDVACIPGEIYPELVIDKVVARAEPGADFPEAPVEPAIYAQLKGPYRMIIGLANDEIGYIIPKRQWDEKAPYCYGRKSSQYGEINSLGPESAPILCQAFKQMVEGKK